MKDTPALLPCPFCGNQPSWRPRIEGMAWVALACIRLSCPARPVVTGDDARQVAARWNTRLGTASGTTRQAAR